jgi:hypothetical protein
LVNAFAILNTSGTPLHPYVFLTVPLPLILCAIIKNALLHALSVPLPLASNAPPGILCTTTFASDVCVIALEIATPKILLTPQAAQQAFIWPPALIVNRALLGVPLAHLIPPVRVASLVTTNPMVRRAPRSVCTHVSLAPQVPSVSHVKTGSNSEETHALSIYHALVKRAPAALSDLRAAANCVHKAVIPVLQIRCAQFVKMGIT